MQQRSPRVSVGLPVYNGENFVAQAIESVLAQSYGDIELIISDNASTDRTADICASYAKNDSRIRYVRHETNRGAGSNFNHVFGLACGEYFKWAAHDDVLAPDFIAACVDALDSADDAVLCDTMVNVIGPDGGARGIYDSRLQGAGSLRPSDRFRALVISRHWCTEIFGLMRRDALARTRLHRSYNASDRTLLAELALIGRFLHVPRPLLMNRDHPDRYSRAVFPDVRKCLTWYEPSMARRVSLQTWRLYGDYWRAVRDLVEDPAERRRCYAHLLRWPFSHWNFARLVIDPLRDIDPRAINVASRIKHRLFGSATSSFMVDGFEGKGER